MTPLQIQQMTAEAFGLKVADLTRKGRKEPAAIARHTAMTLTKERFPKMSYHEIGRRYGKREHGAVVHAIQRVNNLGPHDRGYAELQRLRAAIAMNANGDMKPYLGKHILFAHGANALLPGIVAAISPNERYVLITGVWYVADEIEILDVLEAPLV